MTFIFKISQMKCALNIFTLTLVLLVQSIWPTMKNEFDIHAVVKTFIQGWTPVSISSLLLQ